MGVIWYLLSGVCHQLPAHALAVQGRPLPLCARCAGLFMAFAVTQAMLTFSGARRRSGMAPGRVMAVLALMVGLWLVDGGNSFVSGQVGCPWLYEPSQLLRLGSGLVAGVALAAAFFPIWQDVAWASTTREPAVAHLRQLLAPIAAAGALGALLLWKPVFPWGVWAVGLTAAVGLAMGLLNTALVLLLLGRESRAERGCQLVPYGLAGLAAAGAEMGSVALLRQLLVTASLALATG